MTYKDLLIRFFSEDISEDEILKLKSWLEENDGNKRIFDNENEIWQETGSYSKHEFYNTDEVWSNLSTKLGISNKKSEKVILLRKTNYRWLIAAACIAFLLSLGVLISWPFIYGLRQGKLSSSIKISTNEGDKANILLPDSTIVVLNTKSTLEYNRNYYKDREIKLSGEAYFNVTTNPAKPFVVQTDNMDITAFGTSFNVLSYGDEENTVVTLEEGNIQVSFVDNELISMQQNNQLIYNKNSKEISVNDVDTRMYISWKENRLQFYNTPLKEVMARLSKTFNFDFELMNENLYDYDYTGTFVDESIEEIMRMLSIVSPISYEVIYRNKKSNENYQNPLIKIW